MIAVVLAPRIEQEQPGLGNLKYVAGVAFAVLLYLSVLLHEISHAVMAQRYGLGVRSISLNFLGGATEIDSETRTPGQEFKVAVVGPLTSLAVGFAAAARPAGRLPTACFGLRGRPPGGGQPDRRCPQPRARPPARRRPRAARAGLEDHRQHAPGHDRGRMGWPRGGRAGARHTPAQPGAAGAQPRRLRLPDRRRDRVVPVVRSDRLHGQCAHPPAVARTQGAPARSTGRRGVRRAPGLRGGTTCQRGRCRSDHRPRRRRPPQRALSARWPCSPPRRSDARGSR